MQHRIRILAGQHKKGNLFFTPNDRLRPTSHRTRETVFNILIHRFFPESIGLPPQEHLKGKRVLDLFAGTGAYGFEAMSRGAQEAIFVDSVRDYTQRIHAQAKQWGLSIETYCTTLPEGFPVIKKEIDIVFIDPPYEMPFPSITALLDHILPILTPEAVIVIERPVASVLEAPAFHLAFERASQRTKLMFLVPENLNTL